MPEPLDHYRADPGDGDEAGLESGVYRVVGSDADTVTLLRVVRDGRRVHEGEVVQVARADVNALAPADNPDTGLGRVRQVPQNLAAHPLVSAAALLAVAAGGYLRLAAGVGEGAYAVGAGLVALWILVK